MMSNFRRGLPILSAALLSAIVLCPAGLAFAQKDGSVTKVTGAAAKISQEQATDAALKVLPGKVTDVTMERKRGKMVWVIEIVADKDGTENDVLIDLNTGAVMGIDR